MASLTIRDIPDETKRKFRAKAAAKGLSMEEEGRRLIAASVATGDRRPKKSIGQMLFEASRPGIDLPIPPRSPARIPNVDE